jgi:hypothetical protein
MLDRKRRLVDHRLLRPTFNVSMPLRNLAHLWGRLLDARDERQAAELLDAVLDRDCGLKSGIESSPRRR